MTLKELLKQIKCKRTYVRKSDMCSGDMFRITLTYKKHKCWFFFNDNYMNKSIKKDFLYCLYLDATAYDECKDDILSFAWQFGYEIESMQKTRRIYSACKKQSERLHRLFNDEEVELLSTIE